jgi:carboxymethylenebutenolidase
MPTTPDANLTVPTADGPMRLYEAKPDGPAAGAVVVIQEAFGVNDHIEDVTRRAAAAGYHAVAPDLFHRLGGPVLGYDQLPQVIELMGGLRDDDFLTDVDAALDHLRQAGWADGQIGIVGFCMGGRVTFLVAARRRLGAAVTFYGAGIVTSMRENFPSLLPEAAGLQTPWLGLFGELDRGIPEADTDTLAKALADAGIDHEIVRYPGAGHGFHCDQRPDYAPEAAADGWRRALGWFGTHLR